MELGYKMEECEIYAMYYIKRNGVDEDKAISRPLCVEVSS